MSYATENILIISGSQCIASRGSERKGHKDPLLSLPILFLTAITRPTHTTPPPLSSSLMNHQAQRVTDDSQLINGNELR